MIFHRMSGFDPKGNNVVKSIKKRWYKIRGESFDL